MPEPLSVPSDKSTAQAIDQFNREMRGQPWYQQWFQKQGLDPNKVKLSKPQREELEQLALQNGAPPDAFDDMMIDPAGNLNTEHGFASLPTWAKVALAAGAVAGGYFAAPALAGSLGGTTGVTGTTAATAATTGGGGTLATIAGVTGTGLTAYDRVNGILQASRNGTDAAATASGNNRRDDETREYRAADLNMRGATAQTGFDDAARKNLYRASVARNPMAGPNNSRGLPTISPEMMEGLTSLEQAALKQTASAKERKPFVPYEPDLAPSTLERVNNVTSPVLSVYSQIAPYLRRSSKPASAATQYASDDPYFGT